VGERGEKKKTRHRRNVVQAQEVAPEVGDGRLCKGRWEMQFQKHGRERASG
jgi:hypothetical protein